MRHHHHCWQFRRQSCYKRWWNIAKGFADIHNHQFANLGFGGGGSLWGGNFGDISSVLPWCTAAHGPGGVSDNIDKVMSIVYGSPRVGHKVGGNPQFDGWPRWDSYTHQSVYEDWLYRAWQGGLRLMVMLAVNNEFMCSLVNKASGRTCSDMEAVDYQLQAAKDMEAYIDNKSGGQGSGWYRIVKTPDEARAAIDAGKLAVVLGIEVDYLFGSYLPSALTKEQILDQLDKYYNLGVRHVFPLHFADNAFGGAAFDKPLQYDPNLGVAQKIAGFAAPYKMTTQDGSGPPYGYRYKGGRMNVQGLTDLGKSLITEMMARGMIIDVDHMSYKSRSDVLDIAEANICPVVSGHTGFVEINNGDKRHEGQLLPAEIERIRALGGMVSIIPHQGNFDEINTFDSGGGTVVQHTCGNSSETLVQAYLYAVSKMQGGPVGIGTDFNGFAGLPGPRFGSEACPGGGTTGHPNKVTYPFVADASGALLNRSMVGQKTFDINVDGLAHMGMLPDLIADFKALGLTNADLSPLLNSAEGYVLVWEKAVNAASGKLIKNIFHTIRFPTSWQPWGNVNAAVAGNPGFIVGIACASLGDNLHVVGRHVDGNLYHTIRFPTSWQPWGNVNAAVAGNPGTFLDVTCASIGDNLHVVGINQDGNLYHTIRFPTSWQPWGNVSATVPNNPLQPGYGFTSTQCASMVNNLHLITTVESLLR